MATTAVTATTTTRLKKMKRQARKMAKQRRRLPNFPPVLFIVVFVLLLATAASANVSSSDTSPSSKHHVPPPRLDFSPPRSIFALRRSLALSGNVGSDILNSRERRRRTSAVQLLLSLRKSRSQPVMSGAAAARSGRVPVHDDDASDDLRAVVNAASKNGNNGSNSGANGANSGSGSGFWPPWPFNHLKKQDHHDADDEDDDEYEGGGGHVTTKRKSNFRKDAGLFWKYFSHRVRVGARQVQQLSSDLSFHLPPAAPPLLLIALLPSRQGAKEAAAAAADAATKASTTVIKRSSSSFARRVSLTSLGVAIISWAHYEIRQQKRLVPLPLRAEYRDYKKAILPPFLPELVPPLEQLDAGAGATMPDEKMEEEEDEDAARLRDEVVADEVLLSDDIKSRIKRELEYLYKAAPKPDTVVPTLQELLRKRMVRCRREEDIRRKAVVEELLALQALKKISRRKGKKKKYDGGENAVAGTIEAPLGYALVTGASRGIGRALAVELARYEIPLILVSRNTGQLKALADEIVSCYGVPCCILQADLSKADAAAKVYRSTKDAGLHVDILVNNAGICTHGEMVDTPTENIEQMVQVNAGSVATLSHLYGKDMKQQRRGRILFVSSIVGAVNAGPGVATYAATKSFEKSLALSMGKELEQYGIGVTCLMPGAVRGTAFKSQSNTDDAVCWKIPFYPRTAEAVAHRGVLAMLAGDPEVCPGWQNKLFLRGVVPMLPQRLTTLIVEFAWNPLHLPWQQKPEETPDEADVETADTTVPNAASYSRFGSIWEPSHTLQPRVLTTLTDKEKPKRSDRPQNESKSDDSEDKAADETYLEVLGVGEEVQKSTKTQQSYPSAEEYFDTIEQSAKDTKSKDAAANSDGVEEATPVPEAFVQQTDPTGSSKTNKELTPSGDPMIGALAGEVEAGLVDIVPPPPAAAADPAPSPTTTEEIAEGPKSAISVLADEIEAEVIKMIPSPDEEAETTAPPPPPSDKDFEMSPKSVILDRDLDVMQYID